jgi:hypothetical protein
MRRSLILIVFLAFGFPLTAQLFGSQAPVAQARSQGSADASSEEKLPDFVAQNDPCIDQPRSFKELKGSFKKGWLPLALDIAGTWVEIGDLSDPPPQSPFPHIRSLNCTGERRGSKFEFVLVANGYSVELHAIGMYCPQEVKMVLDREGSVEFPEASFGGDEAPDTYRCRLTKRGTLACMIGKFTGVEFKKMAVEKEQIYEATCP